jgi:hypothetical protein
VLFVLIIAGLFGGGLFLAWQKHKQRILNSPEFHVGPGQVVITPLPAWIHTDILAEVFRDPRLGGSLSIMDDDLVERLKKVFEDHPWVARVIRIVKHHPGSVDVALEYRRPVCMVQVPGGVLAIDAYGVVLPSADFSPVEAARYPLLLGVEQKPTGPVGQRWSDAKVIGGAEIAAAFGPAWELLNLQRINPLADDPTATAIDPTRRAREPFFVLSTRAGTQIFWGYAPGANVLGEIPAAEKVSRLKKYQSDHDALDDPKNERRQIDIRTLGKSGG